MPINKRGEFVREQNFTPIENPEAEKAKQEARALTERQDQEPDSDPDITSAEKKAAMKKRLLGE